MRAEVLLLVTKSSRFSDFELCKSVW